MFNKQNGRGVSKVVPFQFLVKTGEPGRGSIPLHKNFLINQDLEKESLHFLDSMIVFQWTRYHHPIY